ncbi:MAG: porin [Betaproteobacteria bacterium]
MQKKVIALAVAGLVSGAAFAQSNVTVYGVMDAYMGQSWADNATGNQKQTVVNAGGNGSSRLGFMGEEALGNGLKAIFRLELGSLTTDAATNSIGNTREAYVGLKSDTLGQFTLGRVQTAGYYWTQKYDTMSIAPLYSLASVVGRKEVFMNSGSAEIGRVANAVTYISPKLGGVTLRADVAAGEQVTGTSGAAGFSNAQGFYALNADYDNGPLAVGLVYTQVNNFGGTLNNVKGLGAKDWGLGASYDFKMVKPFLMYQESKFEQLVGNDIKNKMWNAGVHVPVGAAGTVKFAYMNYKNDQSNAVKAEGYALAYEHALSKRTKLYAAYQTINNGTFGTLYTGGSSTRTTADKDASVYGFGIRHNF